MSMTEALISALLGLALTAAAISLFGVYFSREIRQRRKLDRLEKIIKKSPSSLEAYVTAVLERRSRAEEQLPSELSALADLPSYRQHIFIAYMLWAGGEIQRAILVAEAGLDEALGKKASTETILRLKNSLAYYYADARSPNKESLARQYAEEAYLGMSGSAEAKDTLGFVKIVFGKTKEEILEGMELCKQAHKEGGPAFFYEKHMKNAGLRLLELEERGRIAEGFLSHT